MNRAKSLYIIAFMGVSTAIGVYAVIRLISGFSIGWAGVALTTLPGVLFLLGAMLLKRTAHSTARLPLILAQGVIGLSFVLWDYFIAEQAPLESLLLAVVGFVLFIVYDFWYSSLDRSETNLRVGALLPSFVVYDLNGQPVPSEQFSGSPHLLLFYRGNWCPICMAQIKELAEQYRELQARGVTVVLISPQPDEKSRNLAQRLSAPMVFLEDRQNRAARKIGLSHRWGVPMGMQLLGYRSETVLPTAILLDRAGRIVWMDETDNYRVRPEPSTFLTVLDGIGS